MNFAHKKRCFLSACHEKKTATRADKLYYILHRKVFISKVVRYISSTRAANVGLSGVDDVDNFRINIEHFELIWWHFFYVCIQVEKDCVLIWRAIKLPIRRKIADSHTQIWRSLNLENVCLDNPLENLLQMVTIQNMFLYKIGNPEAQTMRVWVSGKDKWAKIENMFLYRRTWTEKRTGATSRAMNFQVVFQGYISSDTIHTPK